MNILVCNVGSTSLKYKLIHMEDETVLYSGGAERVGNPNSTFYINESSGRNSYAVPMPSHREAIQEMLKHFSESLINCVSFKVVHAKGVTGTQLLTDDVLQAMKDFISVAPAHNPPYLAAIYQFRELLPGVPLVGSFETGFHQNIPDEAKYYSIPFEISEKYAIHRYGFHGASHEYMSRTCAKLYGSENIRLISCHLGGSGSVCAIRNGVSIDTSMGLSLQCGVLQNNRIGDIDPYIIFYLAEECGMSLSEIKTMLQTKSGLLGVSGVSNDLRDIEAAAAANKRAELALKMYFYTVKKYIGSYLAVLGGADAICFGGGIGTNSVTLRESVLSSMEYAGILLDREKNRTARPSDDISKPESKTRIYLIETNEEITIARKAYEYLKHQ